MRQVDGSDLLGQGDPRNADIGILYVEAEDSRQEILTAINAQELQGRKQIAIVLPEQGKAFRQPVEFDGLKNMRRGLKAQLIFIAPSGPGPAEFARHRRFVVYSSLETFKTALLAERPLNPRAQSAAGEAKKAGILGRGRGSKGRDQGVGSIPAAPVTPRLAPGVPPVMPPTPPTPRVAPQSAGPQSPVPASRFEQPISPIPPGSSPSIEEMETHTLELENPPTASPPPRGGGALTVNALDDDEGLAPPTTPRQAGAPVDPSLLPTRPDAPARGSEPRRLPTPLLLGQQTNTPRPGSGNLPAASAQGSQIRRGSSKQPAVSGRSSKPLPGAPQDTPEVSPAAKQPNGKNGGQGKSGGTGKMPAVIPVGVVLPAGSSGAAPAGTPRGNTPAGNAGPTPAVASAATTVAATAGGSGSSGTGQRQVGLTPLPPPVSRRHRNRWRRPFILTVLIILSLLLIGGITAQALGGFKGLASLGRLTATVTITPRSQTVQNQYLLTGVLAPTVPNPTQRQVAVTQVGPQTDTQQKSGQATGSIGATHAVGPLTFLNTTTSGITVPGGGKTVLATSSGVQVTFNEDVFVPATGSASKTINDAYVIQIGARGNIPTFSVNGPCCPTGLFVKNPSPFGGGKDPSPAVQQSDIDGVANPLINQLKAGIQTKLKGQIKNGYREVDGSLVCKQPTVTSNPVVNVADPSGSFTVTVSSSCTEEAFDLTGAQQIASGLLLTDPPKDVDLVGYKLVGQVITNFVSATVLGSDGQVRVNMQAAGKWVYQFDAQKQAQIKQALIKQSKANAQNILAQYSGVLSAQIDLSSGSTMPDNVNDITLTITQVPGLQPSTPTAVPTVPGGSNITPTPCPSASGSASASTNGTFLSGPSCG